MAQAFLTAAFYRFVTLDDTPALRTGLLAQCAAHQVKGNVLLAAEGINGTIAGPVDGVRAVLAWLKRDPRLAALQHKEAQGTRDPFYRMKVSLKREIVTLGVPDVQPAKNAGTYVSPEDWNQLIRQPDVVVVDTPYHVVTDARGQGRIEAPAGSYTLRVWHPGLKGGKLHEETVVLSAAPLERTVALSLVATPAAPAPTADKLRALQEKFRKLKEKK